MSKSFVQVPPQSTGKKLLTEFRKELFFNNNVREIEIGDLLIGATSNASGRVTGIATEGYAEGAGELYLENFEGTFVDNEPLQRNNITYATVDVGVSTPQENFDMQKIVITDADNPEYNQKIDRFGATVNTFTDGSPTFGPFGTLTVGEPQVIKFYRFAYNNVDNLWHTDIAGSGATSWDGVRAASQFNVGMLAGDKVSRTTNYYHPYIPGVGRNIEFTCQFGDNGKTNLVRRMGYFDDNDGIFFEQDGTTIYIVLRSSVSGTPVDTRVAQDDWNLDKANGTDSIAFNLDFTKANMFWIDLQWHGAGRVKIGVYEPLGSRIPIHAFKFIGISDNYPYMRTASLPLRFEMENTGNTISGSTMRTTSSVVRHTSRAQINGDKWTSNSTVKTITDTDGEIPILSFRPKLTFNGYTNRSIFKGLDVQTINFGSEAVIWRIRFDPYGIALANSDFQSVNDFSTTEYDISSTTVNQSLSQSLVETIGSKDGAARALLNDESRDLHTFENVLCADSITQPNVILTAQVIRTGNTEIFASMNWEEFKL